MAVVKIRAITEHPDASLCYDTNPIKTDNGTLVFSNKCSTDWELAHIQMEVHRKRFNKNTRHLAYQIMVSYHGQEVLPEKAKEIAMEFAEGKFSNYQYLAGVHVNTKNIHFHFVVNAVDMNGKKYNDCTRTFNELRAWSDTLCEKYGLEVVIPKDKGMSYKEYMERKEDTSWKEEIRKDIDAAISHADSFEDFLHLMKEQGYFVKHGDNVKHIVFKKAGMERGCRGRKIGVDYTEEVIRKRIRYKEFHLSSGAIQFRKKKQGLTAAQKDYWGLTHRKARLSTVLALWLHVMAGTKEVNFRKVAPGRKRAYQSKYLSKVRELSEQLFFVKENNIASRDEVNTCLLNFTQQLNQTEDWKERKAIEKEMQPYKKLLKTLEEIQERRIIPNSLLVSEKPEKSAVKDTAKYHQHR